MYIVNGTTHILFIVLFSIETVFLTAASTFVITNQAALESDLLVYTHMLQTIKLIMLDYQYNELMYAKAILNYAK